MEAKVTWPTIRLGELAEFRNGVNYNKNSFGKGIKVLGVADFQDYLKPRYAELQQINPEGVVTERNILEDGDIVFVRSNGNRELIGRSLLIENPPERITHSAFTIRLRFTRKDICPRFYSYLFRTRLIRDALTAHGGGTNISNLNQDILGALTVPQPPLPVQERVAAVLSAYHELIENNQRRIRILEEMVRALYREWFVEFRFPGHEEVGRVASALGDIPHGWEVKRLNELFEFVGGSQPPKNEHVYDEAPGYVRFIQNRDYGSSQHLTYIKESRKNKLCDRLDIMVDKYGEPGKARFGLSGAYNVALAKLVPSKPSLREWLRALVSEPDFTTYLAGASMAATRASLNNSHYAVDVVVPPDKTLGTFQAIVEPVLKLVLTYQDSIQVLRRTRDLLLPRLVAGSQSHIQESLP